MFADIVQKIATEAQITPEQVQAKIEEKKEELSQMISDEGAAYIVAKELGVNVLRQTIDMKIENITAEMKNVELLGKVIRMSPIKEFKTEKAEGRVMSVWIADETGSVRISLWNDEIDKASGLEQGDVIRIKGYVRENLGQPEIRLGRFGKIVRTEREIRDVKTFSKTIERGPLMDLVEGGSKEVRAVLAKVFDGNMFYEVCSCGKHLKKTDEGSVCEEHGNVSPEYHVFLSGIIDDGTENIRAVFFREQAEKLLGMPAAEAKKLVDSTGDKKTLLSRIPIGKEFVFRGNARRNTFFNRLEFIVNEIREVNVKQEIELLLKQEA